MFFQIHGSQFEIIKYPKTLFQRKTSFVTVFIDDRIELYKARIIMNKVLQVLVSTVFSYESMIQAKVKKLLDFTFSIWQLSKLFKVFKPGLSH